VPALRKHLAARFDIKDAQRATDLYIAYFTGKASAEEAYLAWLPLVRKQLWKRCRAFETEFQAEIESRVLLELWKYFIFCEPTVLQNKLITHYMWGRISFIIRDVIRKELKEFLNLIDFAWNNYPPIYGRLEKHLDFENAYYAFQVNQNLVQEIAENLRFEGHERSLCLELLCLFQNGEKADKELLKQKYDVTFTQLKFFMDYITYHIRVYLRAHAWGFEIWDTKLRRIHETFSPGSDAMDEVDPSEVPFDLEGVIDMIGNADE